MKFLWQIDDNLINPIGENLGIQFMTILVLDTDPVIVQSLMNKDWQFSQYIS